MSQPHFKISVSGHHSYDDDTNSQRAGHELASDCILVPITLPELPQEYPDYSSVEFWNKRYEGMGAQDRQPGQSEWYLDFQTLLPYLQKMPAMDEKSKEHNQEAEVLVLGCGNSALSLQIYKQLGFECITNIDFSHVLIAQMKEFMEQLKDQAGNLLYEQMEYIQFDICDPAQAQSEPGQELVEKDSYDIVIDKGCLDCIACHEDIDKMQQAVDNVHEYLVAGGLYFLVSRGSPATRRHLFESPDRQVEASEVNDESSDEMDADFKALSSIDPAKWSVVRCFTVKNTKAVHASTAFDQLHQLDLQNEVFYVYIAEKRGV